MSLNTPLTDLLGCRYPVVQTAMGWVADARLVAATTNAGGFGFLAAATMTTDTLREQIAVVSSACAGKFGVNFSSEESRVGKECASTCRSRRAQDHLQQKHQKHSKNDK